MAKTLPCELSLSQCFLSPGVGAVLQPGEMDAQKVMEGAGQGPQVCSRVRCRKREAGNLGEKNLSLSIFGKRKRDVLFPKSTNIV